TVVAFNFKLAYSDDIYFRLRSSRRRNSPR
ncbi:unnamed protein product, partial [marine sediment metagenome]